MKRKLKIIIQCFGLLLWLTAFSYAQQADKPALKNGDTWMFDVSEKGQIGSTSEALGGMYELRYSQGHVNISFVSGNRMEELNAKGPAKHLLVLLGLVNDRPDLKFPLKVGQRWTYEYESSQRGSGKSRSASVEINVSATEEISVPAGKFMAFKLVKEEQGSGGRRGSGHGSTTTYYYSVDTKSIIKSSYESTGTRKIELVKFTSGQ